MPRPNKYSPELSERVGRMVFDHAELFLERGDEGACRREILDVGVHGARRAD